MDQDTPFWAKRGPKLTRDGKPRTRVCLADFDAEIRRMSATMSDQLIARTLGVATTSIANYRRTHRISGRGRYIRDDNWEYLARLEANEIFERRFKEAIDGKGSY